MLTTALTLEGFAQCFRLVVLVVMRSKIVSEYWQLEIRNFFFFLYSTHFQSLILHLLSVDVRDIPPSLALTMFALSIFREHQHSHGWLSVFNNQRLRELILVKLQSRR